MLYVAVLHLDDLQIVLVLLDLVAEPLGVVLRLLVVEADGVLLIVLGIDLHKIELILQCKALNIEQLALIIELVLCLLNLMLVLEEVF